MCLKSSHRVNVYFQNDIVHVITVKWSFDPKSLGINLHEAHIVQNDIVHVVTVKLSFDPKSLGINLHEAHYVPYKEELES